MPAAQRGACTCCHRRRYTISPVLRYAQLDTCRPSPFAGSCRLPAGLFLGGAGLGDYCDVPAGLPVAGYSRYHPPPSTTTLPFRCCIYPRVQCCRALPFAAHYAC